MVSIDSGFTAPKVKYEKAFRDTVDRHVKGLIANDDDRWCLYAGAEVDGEPDMNIWYFDVEPVLDENDELRADLWLVAVEEFLAKECKFVPTFMALTVPTCVARWNGDAETGDFIATMIHTWIAHEVELTPRDPNIPFEHGKYAYERFVAPENAGLLETMSDCLIDFVIRKG